MEPQRRDGWKRLAARSRWPVVAVLLLSLPGCYAGVTSIGVPTASSSMLDAVIVLSSTPSSSDGSSPIGPFVSIGCAVGLSQISGTFAISMTASSSVDVDHVTVHMIDGTNLGGPSVTVPQPALAAQFGTTHIAVGTTRLFDFHTQFPCDRHPRPVALSADIHFFDSLGVLHTLTVTKPL